LPNAKLRCKHKPCGKYEYRNEMIRHGNLVFCSDECKISWAIAKGNKDREKAKKKKNAAFKDKFHQSDLKTRKAAAKAACHAYIRERDKGLPCICCDRPANKKMDAGHWLESGNNPLIRYDEDNINSQLVYCNQYQGGDSDDYEGKLRIKIGNERVDRLKAMKGGTIKRTCDDYKEIELYYKQKLKEIRG